LKPQPDIEQLKRVLLRFYVTIFGHFKGKSQQNFILEGFEGEKYKYFKPRPDIAQLKRVLLRFYVTIFGHFKGKSQKKFF